MNRYLFAIVFVFSIIACTKNNDFDGVYTFKARVAAFDLNCEICVLEFPNDSEVMKKLAGEIPYNNLYNAVNLDNEGFEIGQDLIVTLRKPQGQEMKACKTLYASYTNQNIFIIKYEKI
jgi:hypothetical protein